MKIAAIALATVDGMVEANDQRALRLVEIALAERPDVVLLPEAYAAGYCGQKLAPLTQTLGSATLRRLAEMSGRAGCMIVTGFLEPGAGEMVRNAAAIFDRGAHVGTHYKHSLWSDAQRAYRDEPSQMIPGPGIEVFPTRFGRLAVMICYENMIPANWEALAGRVDFVLSPYNCEHDPARHNVPAARRLGIPSAWADRTGTVYAGATWEANPGSAGMVAADGRELAHTAPGVEAIAVAELPEKSLHGVDGKVSAR